AVFGLKALQSDSKSEFVQEPIGLEAMTSLEWLPYLKPFTFAGGASSFDRTMGNSDGFGRSNFLYTDEHGDKVMMDMKGAGTVYRIWFTGFDAVNAYIKIYFDGEETPRINMPVRDMVWGIK